jgi:hypothetical protein
MAHWSERTNLLPTNVSAKHYISVPPGTTADEAAQRSSRRRRRRIQILATMGVIAVVALALASTSHVVGVPSADKGFDPVTPLLHLLPGVAHNLAMYSPYDPAGIYPPPPPGCKVNQVNIVRMPFSMIDQSVK